MGSVQFSCSVVYDSLQSYELHHARRPCPLPTPGVQPNPSIESVIPSNHLILSHPLLFLPSIFPSIRVFSNESALCIRYLKYWSFSFNISPFSEHQRLMSFRMDWGWISLQFNGLSRVFSNNTVKSINSSALSFLYSPTLTSICDY